MTPILWTNTAPTHFEEFFKRSHFTAAIIMDTAAQMELSLVAIIVGPSLQLSSLFPLTGAVPKLAMKYPTDLLW